MTNIRSHSVLDCTIPNGARSAQERESTIKVEYQSITRVLKILNHVVVSPYTRPTQPPTPSTNFHMISIQCFSFSSFSDSLKICLLPKFHNLSKIPPRLSFWTPFIRLDRSIHRFSFFLLTYSFHQANIPQLIWARDIVHVGQSILVAKPGILGAETRSAFGL